MSTLPLLPENIPPELKAGRFACSRVKVPYIPGTDRKASCSDPSTWRSYDEAMAAYRRGGYDGIWLATEPDSGLVGLDFDHCGDAATGRIEPWAKGYVDLLNSYTEWSPSALGLRVFVRAVKSADRSRKGPVEYYDRARFLSVTGHHLGGTPTTIEGRQAELAEPLVGGGPERVEVGGLQGRNDLGQIGYRGPCPPPGRAHEYRFSLYALDGPLGLGPGVSGQDILAAAEGHVLERAQAVTTYQRSVWPWG